MASIAGMTVGVGLGLFGSHIGPLLLASTPQSHLARVQAVLALVQALPLIVTLNLAGVIADQTGAAFAIVGCGLLSLIAGLAGITNRSVRTASLR